MDFKSLNFVEQLGRGINIFCMDFAFAWSLREVEQIAELFRSGSDTGIGLHTYER